jgi:hypothetical protein
MNGKSLSTQPFFQIGEVVPLLERSKNVREIFFLFES